MAKLLEVSEVAVIEEVEKEAVEEKTPEPTIKQNSPSREETLVSLILKLKPEVLKDIRIRQIIKTPILKRLAEEFDGNPKNLPKELFDKFGELLLYPQISELGNPKKEINDIYKLLSLEDLKQRQIAEKDEKELQTLQQKFKDFNSDDFERIIV